MNSSCTPYSFKIQSHSNMIGKGLFSFPNSFEIYERCVNPEGWIVWTVKKPPSTVWKMSRSPDHCTWMNVFESNCNVSSTCSRYQTFLTLVTLSTLSSSFEWTVKKPADMVWKMSPSSFHIYLNISLYDIFDSFYIFSADIIIVLSGHPRWKLDKKSTKLE